MDRKPDVQRNLELSGSTALAAFLDGSADLSSFSRCGAACGMRQHNSTLCTQGVGKLPRWPGHKLEIT